MNMFRTAVAALILSSSGVAMADDYIRGDEIQTVNAGANGVTFNFDPGEGGAVQSAVISGTAGSDCLRMFMYYTSLKKEGGDTDGYTFSINKTQKTCTMQVQLIGA